MTTLQQRYCMFTAMEFAAIQCQIHFGDYQEEKHKPGLIENLNEYLPEQYSSSWGAEKKILKLFSKHHGLSSLEAKHLYIKTARDLPTYGVTFFVVKEKQKGKKKMVPRLLGINSESILRLDEVTKEILQVWPLTHVKTYHAGKNDTFTLNFGDYSDKEYSVKTNDALRIRDILEGYIDIIKRRLCGPFNTHHADSGTIGEDSVHSGRGSTMTHVVHAPSKVIEENIVGPTKIIPFEQGMQASTGTQVMTVQQVIVTNMGSSKQEIVSGEVPMRSDMSQELVKKLNRTNSNAVKIVTLLTEPTEANIQQARSILATIEADIPIIQTGVTEAAEKQNTEEAKNKLLRELAELNTLLDGLSRRMKNDHLEAEDAQNESRQIADLTTQMYFSLDPRTRKRSVLLRRSRPSFIEDEQTVATLRRASFIAAAGAASHAAGNASEALLQEYTGAELSDQEVDRLEKAAVDKLGKLNAAIALFLTAHADAKNIDYDAAVNSMNTIKELLPELADEAKAISHSKGGAEGQEILDEVKALTAAVHRVCMLTGCDDHQKIQDAAQSYADASGRLVYIVGSGNPRVSADKENEIMELAKTVGDMTTVLLVGANELTEQVSGDPRAALVDGAGVHCAHAARDLLLTAQLTAPTIREAHCQSALSAACEVVSQAARALAATWRPLADTRRASALAAHTLHLARALDRLKDAYAHFGPDVEEEQPPELARKLQFIATTNTARNKLQDAGKLLDEPIQPAKLSDREINDLQDNISEKLAQNNAAVASLLQAKSDPQNPDYDRTELAINTIAEVTPAVVKDIRSVLSSCPDERAQRAMLCDVRALCAASGAVCAGAASDDNKELEDAAQKYAQSSKKLSFAFSPLARKAREQLMMELFDSAHKQALQMVDDTNKMADSMGGAGGERLRALGRDVAHSASALHTTLMVTSPSLASEQCRSALLSSSAGLSAAANRLTTEAETLQDEETGCRVLSAQLAAHRAHVTAHGDALQRALTAIRHTLQVHDTITEHAESPAQKVQRLKFITSASAVQDKAQEVEQLLIQVDEDVKPVKLNEQQVKELDDKRARELAAVNAAVALLINAKNDHQNPDYAAAEEAIETVSELMPGIINDTKALSACCESAADRARQVADMREWCVAVRAVCARATEPQLTEFVESAQHFADTSNRMSFVFNPRKISPKKQQVSVQSARACETAARMCGDARECARGLPAEPAAHINLRAQSTDDAAAALRVTTLLTAPCLSEPRSRAALIASSEHLGAAADDLLTQADTETDLRCKELATRLTADKHHLDEALRGIKKSCADGNTDGAEDPTKKAQRLKFLTSISAVHDKLDTADNMLQQPSHGLKLTEQQAKDVQERLSQDVARINAAITELLQAKSDVQNPDYVTAEKSIETISEVMPSIVKDTKALSLSCAEEQARAAMVRDMQAWADAVRHVIGAAADHHTAQDLEKVVQKVASASGKMKFVVSGRKNPMKESEVNQSANAAIALATQMATEAELVAGTMRGGAPALQSCADKLLRAARALHSAAQLTAPSIHERSSQTALISCADAVRAAGAELTLAAQSSPEPGLKILGVELQAQGNKLNAALQDLKDICANRKISIATLKVQQQKFASNATIAENKAKEAERLLEQPASGTLSDIGTIDVQQKLSKAMAQVNAALASLINAKSDSQQPNYVAADTSLATISELMPEIINDTKDLSTTCKEDAVRATMLEDIREWCRAIQAVCASAASEQNKELNESAAQFSKASQKLRFIITARQNPVKEQQIMQLSSSACDKARQIVDETRRVAAVVKGTEGDMLLSHSNAVSDAAAALQTTAQLTAASIEEPGCCEALVSSAEQVSVRAHALTRDTARAHHHAARRLSEEVGRYTEILDRGLLALKAAVHADDKRGRPPPPPVKRSSLSNRSSQRGADSRRSSGAGGAGGSVPSSPRGGGGGGGRVRVVSHSDTRRASQDWLHHMRQDATQDIESNLPRASLTASDIAELNRKAEEERRRKEIFEQTADDAAHSLQSAEQDLHKLYKSAPASLPDVEQAEAAQRQTEQRLALAGTAAAKLVTGCHPDVTDYELATEATETLSGLVPDIVKDAALLSNTKDERTRRALLDHIRALCEATKRLVGSARDNSQKVNEAAVDFGDKSAALLYAVASEVDPAQEKEVIERARVIGDVSSSLAEGVAGVAGVAGGVGAGGGGAALHRMCDTGRHAADAARSLVYTAKLVAPSIHHQQCQNALITASHELSSKLKDFSASWKPLASEPQHAKAVTEMTAEANHLEKLLESFRQDLAAGKFVKRREVEKIIVEDTPLTQLASQIMELAQMRAECDSTAGDKRRACAEYAGSLRDALLLLHTAAARMRTNPRNLEKHQELESAVQNLQICLLQSRPALGDQAQNNIVDLTDFVKETSKEADKLLTTTTKLKSTKEDKKELENIKQDCHAINLSAFRLLNPAEQQESDESSVDGILEVDQFGQECEDRIKNIKANISGLKGQESKHTLQDGSLSLVESCGYLRFATKSALAAAKSASLDDTLEDLNELEKRLDKMLAPGEVTKPAGKDTSAAGLISARSRLLVAAGGVSSDSRRLAPSLAAYTAQLRAATDLHNNHQMHRTKEHLLRVIHLLKEMVATTSSRVATWQPLPCAQLATLTEQLVQELENPPLMDVADGEKAPGKVLNDAHINRLLMPVDAKIEGDPKKIEKSMEQSAGKLVMLLDTLTSSGARPDSLTRTAPALTEAALQLAASATSLPPKNLAQAKRTEEAAQEMCWASYNLLKTAESVTREHTRPDARARLRDASLALHDAVNKLTQRAWCGDRLRGECGALSRQLQRARLAPHPPPPPPPPPPYPHCLQLLDTQRDVILKLNSDEPMSREEFGKSLNYVTAAVSNTAQFAEQCSYLIALSEHNKELAMEGMVDVTRLQKLTSAIQESCYLVMRTTQLEMAKEEESKVSRVNQELQHAVKEASAKSKHGGLKRELTECAFKLDLATKAFSGAVHDKNASMDKVTSCALSLAESAGAVLERASAQPAATQVSAHTQEMIDDVSNNSKKLISNMQALIKEVKDSSEDDDPMTWVTYNTKRTGVVEAFEHLLNSLKRNGERSGLVEVAKEVQEEPDLPKKSYIQMQEEKARKWLQRRPSNSEVQTAGEQAARAVIDVAQELAEDMKGNEKEEMLHLITESRQLVADCTKKYDSDKASLLMESLREMRRAVERGAVTSVVEDFLHAEEPLADLDILADAERDEAKRKFLLEQKIAELMSQLGRVKRTARLVSRAAHTDKQLDTCTQQTELLAPLLVQAAQERVSRPHDAAVVERYRAALAQYAAALSALRERCDHSVDPLDFVQTAGETMSRMREESSQHNDPRLCAYTSNAITRLANRVIVVSMSSSVARSDPELRAALSEAQEKLAANTPAPGTRESRLPDWKDTTAEILRTTGEVESALGGENIFKKLPEPDQPIYNAALSLHSAVRGWSARDNEIVAVAKRMAVLMARLSEQMNTERKRELIATSKSIVTESREVAALAKKLAQECADVRIKTNLLQVCERIPTISGQLKMLTTVKGSTLGNQGGEEDREAMNMLVTNAQNLMSSVQEVVKAAASASVKIASQRGLKWVRKNY